MKSAMKDSLFMNDLDEISEDFKVIDIAEWDCTALFPKYKRIKL